MNVALDGIGRITETVMESKRLRPCSFCCLFLIEFNHIVTVKKYQTCVGRMRHGGYEIELDVIWYNTHWHPCPLRTFD